MKSLIPQLCWGEQNSWKGSVIYSENAEFFSWWYENSMQKIEYKSRYLKDIDNEIIFCYISVGKRVKYRKEITIYVFTKNYNEKEIGKYASAGKDKLWIQ